MNVNNGIEQQLLAMTRKFLSELQAERALQAITLDASLERELGIDSLGKVELFHRIERAFSVHLPDKAITEVVTLRDLIKTIKHSNIDTVLRTKKQQFSPVLESTKLDLTSTSSLYEVLYAYAEKEPNRPHIYLQDEQGSEQIIHYGQLVKKAEAIARGLHQHGIQPGETVAIMLPTSDTFFYTFCGVILAGAIPVPIYPPFRADRIEEYAKREAGILRNAQARLLVTFAAAETLSKMLQTFVPSLTKAITVKNLQASTGVLPTVDIEPDDITLIQYTSGSTGEPKGVTLTHRNMLANIRAIEKAIGIKPTDVCVSWLPLYHDMGLMSWLGSLYFGVPVTILSPLTFLRHPERWLWTIHYHRATISGGPNFSYELCVKKIESNDIEGLDLSSWRYAFNGAEAIGPKTLERFAKKFSPYGFKLESFAPVYGLAEATVGLTFPSKKREPRIDKIQRKLFEKENKAIPASKARETVEYVGCGEVLAEHEIRIVDDKGAELPERRVGNIQFKGPSAMQGYYNNSQLTQKAFNDGWWNTGDLGYLADKELFITGRKKDLIIKAGRNLYPEEIEEILNRVSDIRKGCSVAFGIIDANSGTEKLVVVAEIYEAAKTKQQAIRAEIIEKMAMELDVPPDIVILVPPKTVPKTSSGKLQRSACKQAYIEGKLGKQQSSAKLQLIKLAFISTGKKIYSWFCYLGRLVYSFYVVIVLVIILPIMWFLSLLFSPPTTAKMVQLFARLFFRLSFCPVAVEGENNLRDQDSLIYVANHASYVDSLALVAVLPTNIVIVAKKELLKAPIIGSFIKKLNYPTVDRMDFAKSVENKSLIEAILEQGQSIVIFPEGTFTYATGLRPFKLGAFIIAAETATPLCPVSLQGTRSILRGSNLLAKPGKIKIVIGKPVVPKEKDWNEITRLHSIMRIEIAKNCGEPVIDVIVAGPVVD